MRWTDALGTSSPAVAETVGGVTGCPSHADSVSAGAASDTSSRSSESSMASVDGLNTNDETAPHCDWLQVWERLKQFVPERVYLFGTVWEAFGLNECWRLAKYSKGDAFTGHTDACFRHDKTVHHSC